MTNMPQRTPPLSWLHGEIRLARNRPRLPTLPVELAGQSPTHARDHDHAH